MWGMWGYQLHYQLVGFVYLNCDGNKSRLTPMMSRYVFSYYRFVKGGAQQIRPYEDVPKSYLVVLFKR